MLNKFFIITGKIINEYPFLKQWYFQKKKNGIVFWDDYLHNGNDLIQISENNPYQQKAG